MDSAYVVDSCLECTVSWFCIEWETGERMRPLKRITSIKAHGLVWLYYKTVNGDYRYITPKTGNDSGPFRTLRALRSYIMERGYNINWQ